MRDWRTVRLGDIADIRVSNVDKKAVAGEWPVRLCNYMDVYGNDYIDAGLDFMEATASPAEIERFKLQKGDVLITKDSETPDDIGIPAVITEDVAGLVAGYHLALVRPRREMVDPVYLAKQISSVTAVSHFSRRAAGSTRYGLSISAVASTPIALAPMAEQRRVAEILSTLDSAIDQTKAIIAKSRFVKTGLMHDLLTRGIDANGDLRPPREEAPHLYQASPLGGIPKPWQVEKLESVSSAVTSGSRDWARFYAESGALFMRIGNLTRDHINFRYDSLMFVRPPQGGDGQRTLLEPGDMLISITADLGIVGVVPAGLGEAYINQHIALVRPDTGAINSRFVGHYLAGPVAQACISRLNDAGAKAGLNLPTIRGLLTVVPKRDEQNQIAARLDEVDKRVQNVSTELEKLQKIKAGLMDDLLSGRVSVKRPTA